MRLTDFEIESIISTATRHFGKDVQVFLFGSRTSNDLRGGDIDIFIRRKDKGLLTARGKINFITDLIMLIGEQKIDVILDNQSPQKSQFLKSISPGIRLC